MAVSMAPWPNDVHRITPTTEGRSSGSCFAVKKRSYDCCLRYLQVPGHSFLWSQFPFYVFKKENTRAIDI